ncbi:hypothetical protein IV203_024965 [Nitzschia inconspicua]|uniref:Uncharacterized protein n=1 Tax=Nitzschia inconspicua TaxID=303405 RepID=A0A9K3KB24_9STRA|nr:hypothetical protein IV203_024965 [Nitzschia inconspicua]
MKTLLILLSLKVLIVSLLLVLLPFAPVDAAHTIRKAIQVGPRDPKNDPIRGEKPVPCDDKEASPIADTDHPCTNGVSDDGVKCDWYAGFQEYYCTCDKSKTDYCETPTNAFCLDGFEETKITLNGGRKFWNCKSDSAFFPPDDAKEP